VFARQPWASSARNRAPQSVDQIAAGVSGRTSWDSADSKAKPLAHDFRNQKDALLLYTR
jgi:hypothetical protein